MMLSRLNWMRCLIGMTFLCSCLEANDRCDPIITGCGCRFPGQIYNLAPIDRKDGIPRFITKNDTFGYKYSYNPCTSFSLSKKQVPGDCNKDVAICRWAAINSSYQNIGTSTSVQCCFNNESNSAELHYSNEKSLPQWKAKVILKCDKSKRTPEEANFTFISDANNIWEFHLTSSSACSLDPCTNEFSSARALSYDHCPMDDACFNNPIGVADKNKIHKAQMKASSGSKNGRPWHGRLNFNKKDGWCPKNNDKPWLQVNFTKSFQVCGVATQGDRKGTKWTIEFTLSFSNDSNEWSCYKNDNGEEMEFLRSNSSDIVDHHRLLKPVPAKFIRFYPTKQVNRSCLRVEVYGTEDTNDCYSNPCVNNGTCIDRVHGYNCTCVPGFEGRNCSINTDDCYPNSCFNKATCRDEVNNYTCACGAGFEGRHCDNNVDDDLNELVYILPLFAAALIVLLVPPLVYRRRIWRCMAHNGKGQHHVEDRNEERQPLIRENVRVEHSDKNEGRGLNNAQNLAHSSPANNSRGNDIPGSSEDNCIGRSESYQGSAVLG